jgi:hypothetical protein
LQAGCNHAQSKDVTLITRRQSPIIQGAAGTANTHEPCSTDIDSQRRRRAHPPPATAYGSSAAPRPETGRRQSHMTDSKKEGNLATHLPSRFQGQLSTFFIKLSSSKPTTPKHFSQISKT